MSLPVSADLLDLLSKGAAALGAGLLLWPYIQRLQGRETVQEAAERSRLRSRTWWAALVLICAALALQRLAAQQTGV